MPKLTKNVLFLPYRHILNSTHRARNPITRSRGLVRGFFPSKKMNNMIAWESQLERRACYLFEFNSNISEYREQPKTFHIPMGSTIRRYTPDFELKYKSGAVEYVEIKPLAKYKTPEIKHHLNLVQIYLNHLGCSFSILTEQDLYHPIRESNLILFRNYQLIKIPTHIYTYCEQFHYTINKFQDLVEMSGALQIAYSLLANNIFSININEKITKNSLITYVGSNQ